jgi:hypothetical protein
LLYVASWPDGRHVNLDDERLLTAQWSGVDPHTVRDWFLDQGVEARLVPPSSRNSDTCVAVKSHNRSSVVSVIKGKKKKGKKEDKPFSNVSPAKARTMLHDGGHHTADGMWHEWTDAQRRALGARSSEGKKKKKKKKSLDHGPRHPNWLRGYEAGARQGRLHDRPPIYGHHGPMLLDESEGSRAYSEGYWHGYNDEYHSREAEGTLRRRKGLSETSGTSGGYVTQDEWVSGDFDTEAPRTPRFEVCAFCMGTGNCSCCGGEGECHGQECPVCGGSGDCGECDGVTHEEHPKKHFRGVRRKGIGKSHQRTVNKAAATEAVDEALGDFEGQYGVRLSAYEESDQKVWVDVGRANEQGIPTSEVRQFLREQGLNVLACDYNRVAVNVAHSGRRAKRGIAANKTTVLENRRGGVPSQEELDFLEGERYEDEARRRDAQVRQNHYRDTAP